MSKLIFFLKFRHNATMRVFILFMTFFVSVLAKEVPSSAAVLNYVEEHLSCCGILRSSSGFVYVKLDDSFIHKLIPFIQDEGFEEPPYFGDPALVGAHITVIYPSELNQEVEECGEEITFVPRECQVVRPLRWEGINEVYILVVDAPELDKIRKKYGLEKQTYDFHVTIGVKKTASQTSLYFLQEDLRASEFLLASPIRIDHSHED